MKAKFAQLPKIGEERVGGERERGDSGSSRNSAQFPRARKECRTELFELAWLAKRLPRSLDPLSRSALISRESTSSNKAARLSVHVTCPRGARTGLEPARRSRQSAAAASLSLLLVITRPLREAFRVSPYSGARWQDDGALPPPPKTARSGSNSINAVSLFQRACERTNQRNIVPLCLLENRRQRFRIFCRATTRAFFGTRFLRFGR